MSAPKRLRAWCTARALFVWFGVLGALGALDVCVLHAFVPAYVIPRYDVPNLRLADRTAGNNLGILFAATAQRVQAKRQRVVALVGDSTVMAWGERDNVTLTQQLSRGVVKANVPNVTVAEFASPGVPADEAAVLVTKALGLGASLVLYAVTPRVICDLARNATDADEYALDSDVAPELGARFLLSRYDSRTLAASFIRSHWALLRFRTEISHTLSQWLVGALAIMPPLPSVGYTIRSIPPIPGGPYWYRTKCNIGLDNIRVQALIRIADACAETGRCLIYSGPLNQRAIERFEPGLVSDFSLLTRRIFQERNVPYRNYAYAVGAPGFLHGPSGPDAIHLNVLGRQRLANLLAPEVARALMAQPQPKT